MRTGLPTYSEDCCAVRDAILFLAFACLIPYVFKRPIVGALAYAVISLMNPHRMTYGPAFDFPFAMLMCVLTLLSLVLSREKKKLPMTAPVVILCLFCVWMTITSLFALEPNLVWREWNRVMKTMLMILVTLMVIRTVSDVKMLAIVVALSLGFWGFKGGMYTILSGGSSGMLGPAGSYITDNNTMALALVTTVPLLVYMVSQVHHKWLKRGVIALATLTALGALGSYSRGALLGASAMVAFLWLKSHNKAKIGLMIILLAPIMYISMPDQWTARMHSIDDYQQDGSAMGRINAWQFAINIASHYPLGGGYLVFTPRLFQLYAPEPTAFHVAHSIYFQVLGEHGYFGLLLFLLLLVFGWRTGTQVIRHCKDKPELNWASRLARMCQVSIIGYMVAGTFLSMAYYDLLYYILIILIGIQKVLMVAPQPDDTPPLRLPFRKRVRQVPSTVEPGHLTSNRHHANVPTHRQR
jgi:putative inorganic carbon (HCO3(-)) transporter